MPDPNRNHQAFLQEFIRLVAADHLSLNELSTRMSYDRGHIGHVINGDRNVTLRFAEQADPAVKAKGALLALYAGTPAPVIGAAHPDLARIESDVETLTLKVDTFLETYRRDHPHSAVDIPSPRDEASKATETTQPDPDQP